MIFSQPSFYHFSQESIELAHWAGDRCGSRDHMKVIDVGCGCGVIGLEWGKQKCDFQYHLDLLEQEHDFLEHINKNVRELNLEKNVSVLHKSLDQYHKPSCYDLILSNPPYFIKGKGRLGEDQRKNNCRHIEEALLIAWFNHVHALLKKEGDFFFVFRDLNWLSKVKSLWHQVECLTKSNYALIHWQKI